MSWCRFLLALACLLCSLRTQAVRAEEPSKPLSVFLIGGFDSEPTADQIANKAPRGVGNSGMFQLAGDLRKDGIRAEYFNWNGASAGKIKEQPAPLSKGIAEQIRRRHQESPADRLAIVGNSWGGHTAWEVSQLLAEEPVVTLDFVVFLDPFSVGRVDKSQPDKLPSNIRRAANLATRNALGWKKWANEPRADFIDLGDPASGFLKKPGPAYDSLFDVKAHIAAEWDAAIHKEIHARLLKVATGDAEPAAGPSSDAKTKARPNILLVMADDQGWGDVAYNGHPVLKTPHLDAMAAAGLRFDRFYAAHPVCSPTRGAVMTGRHPNRCGCFSWGHTLRPQEVTVAEALKSAGYSTGHFGKWHLGSIQKSSPVNPGASGFDRWLSAYNFYDNDPILSREGVATQFHGESSQVAAAAAIEFMRGQSATKQPFLAVVWFGSPHNPHKAADEDAALYKSEGKKADFLGEMTGLDRAVGSLRAALRELKIERDTVVWYTSDNGGLPGLGSTGGRGNKDAISEGALRVPGIIEWPDRIAPRVTNIPACSEDIFPTVVELAAARPGSQHPLDGISLLPLIDGKMAAREKPLGFWNHPTGGIGTPHDKWASELLVAQKSGDEIGDKSRLVLDAAEIKRQYPEDQFPGHSAWNVWPWKLHRIQNKNNVVKWELYNLADDPQEANDVSKQESERVRRMRVELETWLTSVTRSLNGKDYAATGI